MQSLESLGAIDISQKSNSPNNAMAPSVESLGAIDVSNIGKSNFSDIENVSKAPITALQKSHPYLYKAAEYISSHPSLSKVTQAAGGLSEKYINQPVQALRLPEISGGLLQGAYSTGRSVENVPGYLIGKTTGTNLSLPKANLGQYLPKDPLSQIAFGAGQLASEVGGYGAALKGAGMIPGLGIKTIPRTMAKGAIAGALTQEDNPLGGRTGGAIVGAALGPLEGLSYKGTADSILNAKNNASKVYGKIYDDYFSKLKGLDLGEMKAPEIDTKYIQQNLPGSNKALRSVVKYQESPTFENAHRAQSDLRKIEQKLKTTKAYDEHNLASATTRAANEAAIARKKIFGAGYEKLNQAGYPELASEYFDISRGYHNDVVPYLNRDIGQYSRGKISPEQLSKSLANNHAFMQSVGRRFHPELRTQALKQKSIKYIGAGLGGALAYELGRTLGVGRYIDKFGQGGQ